MPDVRSFKDKNIFVLSICALLYFSFLLLNSMYFKFENTAFSIILELFTIPIIVGQIVLLVFVWRNFKGTNYSIRTLTFFSLIILIISNGFVFISFLSR